MFKAISRSSVDLTTGEAISVLFQILNVKEATNNDKVPKFEKAYASYVGTKEAVAFPYCRTGMYYALKALELEEGSEVIFPAYTFFVDAAMAVLAGLKPVFVDVEFETSSIDVSQIEKAITPKTKVLFPTHLNGMPADMDPIMELAQKHNLRVIEDCARSCGATYKGKRIGSYDIGAFSFGYGKSFYGFGGAMVASNDEKFIAKLREFKKDFKLISAKDLYIQKIKGIILKYLNMPYFYRLSLYQIIYKFQVEGNEKYASRFRVRMPPYETVPDIFKVDMNNVQAKLGFKQLKRIDKTNKQRMAHARLLNEELSGIPGLTIPLLRDDREYVAVHYALWTEKSKELQNYLTRNKIDAQDETAVNTTTLERFASYAQGEFPNAAKLQGNVIFLPTHPYLSKNDILYMAQKVKEFFNK